MTDLFFRMKHGLFSLKNRFKSFSYAFNGLRILIKEEHNSRIHFFVGVCVVMASTIMKISTSEWIAVVFAIGFVLASEIMNTAIENISDFVCPDKNEKIKKIKDLSAAAVLISVMTAAIVGVVIFFPKILYHLNNFY